MSTKPILHGSLTSPGLALDPLASRTASIGRSAVEASPAPLLREVSAAALRARVIEAYLPSREGRGDTHEMQLPQPPSPALKAGRGGLGETANAGHRLNDGEGSLWGQI